MHFDYHSMLFAFLSLVLSYLIGSLPFAVWISKSFYGADIRTFGSGNAGSTNMYRTFGFKAGFVTQVLDVLKGTVAALLPFFLSYNNDNAVADTSSDSRLMIIHQIVCGVLAVAGHTYPIFAGFRGGKGVNTILGMMLAVHPVGSLIGLLTFFVTLLAGKMVSLASMCAVAMFPFFLIFKKIFLPNAFTAGEGLLLYVGMLLAIWVIYTHRENIRRIRAGNERKIDLLNKLFASKSQPKTEESK